MKKTYLASGYTYHIYTKSISGFNIFNTTEEYQRIVNALKYYQPDDHKIPLSCHLKTNGNDIPLPTDKNKLCQIIAYCLMSTHLHLILKQLKDQGISAFMSNILNSYTRYFNKKHNRKGPLWEGRFKKVLVENEEQLLHLTRYLHLNPTTAHMVEKPEDWPFSSYREYLSKVKDEDRICYYDDILSIEPDFYKEFVEEQIKFQRELAIIKKLLTS